MPSNPTSWDEESAAWDQPAGATWDSSPPEPPKKPKKKPFHRAPKTHHPAPPIPTTMSHTFKYNVAPLAGGGFTTRAVRGTQTDEASMTAAIAAATSVDPLKVPLVIQTFFQQVLLSAATGGWSTEIYGCVSYRPTSGGNEPSPADFHTPDDLNADISISSSAEKIRQWRSTLSLESMGEVGLITPVIDSILDMTTGQADHYTPANMVQLRGSDLRFKLSDATQGVFFRSGSAAEVRASLYGQNEPGIVSAAIPAALTGPLQVRISSFINGSVRSYTYTHLIVPVV